MVSFIPFHKSIHQNCLKTTRDISYSHQRTLAYSNYSNNIAPAPSYTQYCSSTSTLASDTGPSGLVVPFAPQAPEPAPKKMRFSRHQTSFIQRIREKLNRHHHHSKHRHSITSRTQEANDDEILESFKLTVEEAKEKREQRQKHWSFIGQCLNSPTTPYSNSSNNLSLSIM